MADVNITGCWMPAGKTDPGCASISKGIYDNSLRLALLKMAQDARGKDKAASPEELALLNSMADDIMSGIGCGHGM